MSTKTAAGEELELPEGAAAVVDGVDANLGDGFELGQDFRRGLAWVIDFLHVDGVLASTLFIARPEVKLVLGIDGFLVIDQGLGGDAGFRFGQIEGHQTDETVMGADDEDFPAFGQQLGAGLTHHGHGANQTV